MTQVLGVFDGALLLKFFIALFALLNPLYGVPVFLSMTKGFTPAERRKTAHTVGITSVVVAIVALLIGEEFLALFGVNVAAFQIAGGIIVLGVALSMLKDPVSPKANSAEPNAQGSSADGSQTRSIAIVPLTIPMIVGPGVIAAVILFTQQIGDKGEVATLMPVVIVMCFLVWLGLLFAETISKFLGDSFINAMTRIMAIILAAVAVEMVIQGTVHALAIHLPGLVKGASLG